MASKYDRVLERGGEDTSFCDNVSDLALARRKAIHEQQFQSPLSTHCFVEKFLDDLDQSGV
jgi:hypothetical protein